MCNHRQVKMDDVSPHPPTLQKWSQSIMKMTAAILLYRHHLESESGLSWLGGGVGSLWSSATLLSHQAGALCQRIWQRINELSHTAPNLLIRLHKETGRRSSVLKFNNRSQDWEVSPFHWELPQPNSIKRLSTGSEKETLGVIEHDTFKPLTFKTTPQSVVLVSFLLLSSCGDLSIYYRDHACSSGP